jgi:hypothetical protein
MLVQVLRGVSRGVVIGREKVRLLQLNVFGTLIDTIFAVT